MHLSGKTISLVSEDYTATIVTMGGAIASLKYKDKYITYPFKPDTVPVGHHGKILAPWPNRIIDGRYDYNGKHYQLPINDVPNACALHGLTAWKEWDIVDMTSNSVELSTHVDPIEGYPFLVKLTAHYEVIDGMGLKVDIKALNEGNETAPLGLGMRPILTCNLMSINDCKLSMPFKQSFTLNERKSPLDNVAVQDINCDFSVPRVVDDFIIDQCFIADERKRVSTVMLEGNKLQVYLKSSAPFVQVFSPDHIDRKGLSVEPMSCAPDAFNNKIGLIDLSEQQYYTLNLIVGAFEHSISKVV